LVSNSEINSRLKIRVLSITKDELNNDLSKAIEFDQSALFKKIYEQEFGTLGGTPYSCLVGDFDFGPSQSDIALLRNISTLAAAAHSPFIGAVSPNMFHLDAFTSLPVPRDLSKIFEGSELAAWNGFRETEDSRYVNLLLPRVLMRLPYGSNTTPCKEFSYEESVDGKDNQKFCWGSPAYAMAQRITAAFAQYSWTSAIRGVEGGGKVEGLPAYSYKTSNGDVELKCPSEVAITDRREKELSDLGFISLCHAKGTDYAVFFGAQSTQKAKTYNLPAATANATISARLPYLLNASRFAHYIKMMIRDKFGSFMTASEVEIYLQNWLADYVLLSDNAQQSLKAKYPLREGKVTVVEDPSSPGSYKAVLFLRPHFQLEELTVSLRLVAKLDS
jgi:type VI secretion system protein ImpC